MKQIRYYIKINKARYKIKEENLLNYKDRNLTEEHDSFPLRIAHNL